MAVLKQCFCYSLRQGSFIIGSYALIVYCIAFAVELWWIVESLLILPAPAYTLCALYFFNFIMAAVLLFGLLIRQRKYLMSWTLMTVLSFFPEAGMVLFMSLYYWPAHKYEYGVIELVYWSLRAMFNVFGAVCVCSLYLTWRDEELILGRLHDLTLASVDSISAAGGILRNGTLHPHGGTLKASSNNLAYQNYAYVDSSTTSPVMGDHTHLNNMTLKSSNNNTNTFLSRNHFGSRSANLNSISSYTMNNQHHHQHQHQLQHQQLQELQHHQSSNNLRASLMRMKSEFNPALLFDPAYRKSRISELGIAGIGLEPPGQPPSGGMHRSRSLWNVSNDDYWNRPPPSRPVSLGYVNHAHQLDQMGYCPPCGGTLLKDSFNPGTLLRHSSTNHLRPPSSNANFHTSSNTINMKNHFQSQRGDGNSNGYLHHSTSQGNGLLISADRQKNWAMAGRRAQSVDGLNNNLFFQRYYGQNIMAHYQPHPSHSRLHQLSHEWSKSSLGLDEQSDDIRSYQDIPL